MVGAFDRHNYGDLLFPLIVEAVVRNKYPSISIEYFSTSKSEMEAYGAKNTTPLGSLFSKFEKSRDFVLIAGGEVLPATWPVILSYLVKPAHAILIRIACKLAGDRFSSYFLSKIMKVNSRLPFVYNKSDFSRDVKVAYNAVGGSHIKEKGDFVRNLLIEKISKSDYISVRDLDTKHYLESKGVNNVNLSPDCAILLSRLFPRTKLKELAGKDIQQFTEKFQTGYLCFQSAFAYIDGHEEIIRKQLSEVNKITGMSVVVFAIGRATGHSDQNTFKAIFSDNSPESLNGIFISNCETVFDIMWLIANSKVYAGTSLHGAITAASYGVSIVALCPNRVTKLSAFLNTWIDNNLFELADYSGLSVAVANLICSSKNVDKNKTELSQDLAIKNFNEMLKLAS